MKIRQSKKPFILLTVAAILATQFQFVFLKDQEETSAVSYCVSDACKAAEAAEAEATAKANNAENAADTLEAEVERLNQEISMYEARIIANEAIAKDLNAQIELNTAKLELQQQALANMLVNLHFDTQADAIMILAGSSSISDYAEKQTRADNAKNQVNLSAQTVKALKEDLESQKTEVERVIADQELQRKAVQDKKKEQEDLIAQYQANAAAYTAAAQEARRKKENEIAAEIARLNSIGAVGQGVDSYPYRDTCPAYNLVGIYYAGYRCQCTSYAGWKVYEYWGYAISAWGDAKNWGNAARSLGFRVDNNPTPHSVAFSTGGAWGHVMWVESVNSNGTINLSEYNNAYSAASHMYGDFGYRVGVSPAGMQYIHFD